MTDEKNQSVIDLISFLIIGQASLGTEEQSKDIICSNIKCPMAVILRCNSIVMAPSLQKALFREA